ncbi:MAG TPA: hypothetical protein VFW85_02740 [Gaiellaceae bacterium]|nr:hypothetical protein [Gaiellaceae bacterium]
MIWLGWRLQRTETLIAAALLGLVAVVLVPTGIEMAHAYSTDGLSHCLGFTKGSPTCGDVIGSFEQRFSPYTALVDWFTLLPGLIGVVLAAPFALELERGTQRLAWTQSITRRRWVTTKLGLAVGSTAIVASALILVLVWWRQPLVKLDGRMDGGAYDSQGVVILGYALFALGLALAIGAVWRRAIPAVMVSFVGYFVARIFFDTWLRKRIASPSSLTWRASDRDPLQLFHSWVISEGPSDSHGHFLGHIKVFCAPGQGVCAFPKRPDYMHALYVPASDFWSLQLVEFGMFAGIALALIAFAGWWTLYRE